MQIPVNNVEMCNSTGTTLSGSIRVNSFINLILLIFTNDYVETIRDLYSILKMKARSRLDYFRIVSVQFDKCRVYGNAFSKDSMSFSTK